MIKIFDRILFDFKASNCEYLAQNQIDMSYDYCLEDYSTTAPYNDQQGISVHPVDVQEYIAWKDGFYQFKKERLEIITKKLSKYYGKTIITDKQLANITCSGKLDLKEELDDVLHTLIQTVPAQITESNEKIYINVKSK